MTFIRFYFFLLALTLFQIAIVWALPELLPVNDTVKAIIFLGVLTGAIFPIAHMGAGKKDGYLFITTAYLSIGLRFILSLCYIIVYRFTRTEYHKSFILAFFIAYIFYTVFEITSLTAKLRPDIKKKPSRNDVTNE
jgi:hypothetical protein